MRTVEWDYENNHLQLIDQRLLPGEFRILRIEDSQQAGMAIRDMVVRGAPAIGAAAGFGMALAGMRSKANTVVELIAELNQAAEELKSARPTAVNLKWAVDRLIKTVHDSEGDDPERLRIDILRAAQQIADEDVAINMRMARHGADLIHDGDTIIHHCNTGALAAVDWGTALGVIRMAHQDGKKIHILVDETRPRLQGSRLTAWELEQYGIPYDIIPDNAAGYYLQTGAAQKVLFGADRVAANGDVANKIGTYKLALAAFDNSVPAYCVAPTSTIDRDTARGDMIPIEDRPQAEVLALTFEGRPAAPENASARNPAFDITPERLVTAIVTENGIAFPPYLTSLSGLFG